MNIKAILPLGINIYQEVSEDEEGCSDQLMAINEALPLS
jgi:hypothetical protein